ncbi:uncharacterized protein LOC111084912 [Limulus polyphemus]|uniref:Uncharacterized protein LOC111084912 n=1 Tax=Limulus polyphemus TaxID=6850 RepID=A0ABM1S0M4_LIMPO|nr:uncharacterized protein LOC111084912 [Limulus polyphemus]
MYEIPNRAEYNVDKEPQNKTLSSEGPELEFVYQEERHYPSGNHPATVAVERRELSAKCVIFTYFTGNADSVVDEHFSRALQGKSTDNKITTAPSSLVTAPMSRRHFPASFWNFSSGPSNKSGGSQNGTVLATTKVHEDVSTSGNVTFKCTSCSSRSSVPFYTNVQQTGQNYWHSISSSTYAYSPNSFSRAPTFACSDLSSGNYYQSSQWPCKLPSDIQSFVPVASFSQSALVPLEQTGDTSIGSSSYNNQHLPRNVIKSNFSSIYNPTRPGMYKPGKTDFVQHKIETTTRDPVKMKTYQMPYVMRDLIKQEVKVMLEARIIEPSNSAFCSPMVIMEKNNSNHFCIDFRKLTKFDSKPLPDAPAPTTEQQVRFFLGFVGYF